MNLRILFLFCGLLFTYNIHSQDIKGLIFDLADVRFELTYDSDSLQVYDINIKQPLDHNDLSKGYFHQRAVLFHRDIDKPVIMNTSGYGLSRRPNELVEFLQCNYLTIEHRYFGESKPENMEWEYLNLQQVTADLHKINETFKSIYRGKWISTGISKGGQTTIYYRYFYPDDVVLSIPYVAPLNESFEDKRIYKFLDEVGTKACRTAIEEYQQNLFKMKAQILPLAKWYSKGKGLEFGYLESFEKAFEFAVLEYPFSFWQWGHKCENIPIKSDDLEAHLDHLLEVVGFDFYGDKSMALYAPHYYQAASQMGYYGYESKGFKKCLHQVGKNPSAAFYPKDAVIKPDISLNRKVLKWLDEGVDNILYIYGELDTWTATGVKEANGKNSKKFVIEGAHHGNARMNNMPDSMQNEFKQYIRRALN